MQAWFQDFLEGLAPRERALLGIGLLVLLPVGLYLYLWQPITAERDRLAVRVGQLRGELVQLRSDGDEVQRLRSQTPIRAAGTLDAIVRLVASRYQLVDKLGTMTPQGNDRLVVNMEGVEFDAWLRWVGELGLQGVSLADCKVEGLPAAGQVRVKATLARSGS
jgi:type II secretory pathway component PulM